MAQPAEPERADGGERHRSQGSSVWSEHFQELQQPSFIHPPFIQQEQTQQLPITPQSILGGTYTLQNDVLRTAQGLARAQPQPTTTVVPPEIPPTPQTPNTSTNPFRVAPKAPPPGHEPSRETLRGLRLFHFTGEDLSLIHI